MQITICIYLFSLTRIFRCAKIHKRFAGIAQSVEQLIRNQQVVCSSHITSSKKSPSSMNLGIFLCVAVKFNTNIVYIQLSDSAFAAGFNICAAAAAFK